MAVIEAVNSITRDGNFLFVRFHFPYSIFECVSIFLIIANYHSRSYTNRKTFSRRNFIKFHFTNTPCDHKRLASIVDSATPADVHFVCRWNVILMTSISFHRLPHRLEHIFDFMAGWLGSHHHVHDYSTTFSWTAVEVYFLKISVQFLCTFEHIRTKVKFLPA